jgi:hypothetical protein
VGCTRVSLAAAAAVTGALGLAACSTGSADPGANVFVSEHVAATQKAAATVVALERAVAGLSRTPGPAELQALDVQARRARRDIAPASEWEVTESGEEEDLSQAELELNEGADSLLGASAALRAYARSPAPQPLARYRSDLARGREHWNQGVRQLWYLAHRPRPPFV